MALLNVAKILVEKDFVGRRVDVFICEKFNEFSRSFIQKLFLKGSISVNEKYVNKHYTLKLGDIVKFVIPDPEKFEIVEEFIPLDIIYEDEDLLVVNKKRGMVVHPAAGNRCSTLVNALMWHCKENLSSIGGVLRPGIVHRIDKNTTGLLAVAKTDCAFKSLCNQIKERSLKRLYVAIVHGRFKEKYGFIDLPIGRNPKDRKKMAVNFINGKRASTYYRVLEEYGDFSYLALKLQTGRTHQIRVHMAYLGHPVAGDDLYGRKLDISKFGLKKGQCLHAKELSFYHCVLKKYVGFSVSPDEYFLEFLNRCKKGL